MSNTGKEEVKKRTREDWKREKELEELRKAGQVPALVDEFGKDINPHIPKYIFSAPWYINATGPTLKHQRPQKISKIKEDSRKKSIKLAPAKKYRDGACENCGAMGHKKRDCLERPRKISVKFKTENLAVDELILPEADLDYDGKRDRWNGFDSDMYSDVIKEYEKVEEAKRLLKEEKLKEDIMLKNSEKDKNEETTSNELVDEDDNEDDVEEKYADHVDMPGTKVDSKQRITVRNLRIREDTAKYLRNLDLDSAYYDPKTRSMRENPYANKKIPPEDLDYAGDNFIRFSGKTKQVYETQVFAWQASEKGIDVHLQVEPTKTELLNKEFKINKEKIKSQIKQSILEKYCTGKNINQDSNDELDDENDNSNKNSSNWNRSDSP